MKKNESNPHKLTIEKNSHELFLLVKDIWELHLTEYITHPLFCSLASRSGEVLSKIHGRQWAGGEGVTAKLQRKWISDNGFKVLRNS